MPEDKFTGHSKGLDSPADSAFAITPHDSNELAQVPRGIYVGGAGTIIATIAGTDITFASAQAGSILPIRPTLIKATGTTATSLVGLV